MSRDGTLLARDGRSVEVFGWEPGNGSRIDLTIAQRAGGGWFVAWPEAGLVGLVRLSHGDRSCSVEERGAPWPASDREAVKRLLWDLYDGGSL